MALELSQHLHSCNDLSLRNSDVRCSVIFRYQYLKVYWNSINTKSCVKDVIPGFAQKAVKLNTEMS